MDIFTKTVTKLEKLPQLNELDFLQEIIENFEDGILILTETGELVHSNTNACRICNQINQSRVKHNSVPLIIWNFCQSLIQNKICSDNITMWSEDIILNRSIIFRLRVRWLSLDLSEEPYLLVIIENCDESLKNIALSEANRYKLTQREAEIWSLYRGKSSYKQIANKLYITVNTVKKHIKNIRAKQQKFYVA